MFTLLLSVVCAAAATLQATTAVTRYADRRWPMHPFMLGQHMFTNFTRMTNEGRDIAVWTTRSHPGGWPANPPTLAWNTNSFVYQFPNHTAYAGCWEGEVNPGQIPMTAITRRHLVTRGHDLSPELLAGQKVWFCDRNDNVVETVILDALQSTSNYDFTIVLLNADLPAGIGTMPVVTLGEVLYKVPTYSPNTNAWARTMFMFEQNGNAGTYDNIAGYYHNWFKGGDSGSPGCLAIPGGPLVVFDNRTTSISMTTNNVQRAQMYCDILSTNNGLNAGNYQIQIYNLSRYPWNP